jgi:hypothetical protein
MRDSTRGQISDTARELMNGISERSHESYTAGLICHIEVRIDDLIGPLMDEIYWIPLGQLRRDWVRVQLKLFPPTKYYILNEEDKFKI